MQYVIMKVQLITTVTVKNGRIAESKLDGFSGRLPDEVVGKETFEALKPLINKFVRSRFVEERQAKNFSVRLRVVARRKTDGLEIDIKIVEVAELVRS
jgi:hypothetical protein